MVGGLEKFREAFADFSDNFVIIGGTGCDEVLSEHLSNEHGDFKKDKIIEI